MHDEKALNAYAVRICWCRIVACCAPCVTNISRTGLRRCAATSLVIFSVCVACFESFGALKYVAVF